MTTRRHVLAGLLATALPRPGWATAGNPAYLAAARDADGRFALYGLGADGTPRFRLPLPARGHAAAAHPQRAEAVAFARRPGHFALVIDCGAGATVARLTPPQGRQFNGHGAFSTDGAVLYTSEQRADDSEGIIGLWDTVGYERLGEVASGGIGPHDMKRRADGTLVVANGGIATDPTDRTKLNLTTMRPNLTLLSPDGAMLDRAELPRDLWQNSIRHLALSPDGTVAFAMQWEGDAGDPVPLLGLWHPGTPARLCPPPDAEMAAMHGYATSVAFNGAGTRIALTSSKGGRVQVFDAKGAPVASHARADVSGVAPADAGFVVTDGNGLIARLTGDGLVPLRRAGVAWDNHLVAIG